jgi:hypothetical protein
MGSIMAETVSYWGFDLPSDGNTHIYPRQDKYGAVGVRERIVYYAKDSVQIVKMEEISVISHRFLKNKNHRLFLEEEFQEWCKKYGIDYKVPHWRITCVERWDQ